MDSSGPRFTALSIALGLMVAGILAAPVPAQGAATAVITARLLATDPAAPEGEPWYLVEVDEIRHGAVPGGVLAVRLASDDAIGRRLAAGALGSDEPLELTLVPEGDGGYRVTAVRAAAGLAVTDPLPPPLAADADQIAADSPDGMQSRTAAATAGAPFEHQVLEIVNEEREANGNLPPLKGVDLLDNAAEGHSFNMADRNFFAHCDLDTGSTPGSRMTAAGYSGNLAAENIAAGQTTPQEVMTTWMGSAGHRNNILSTLSRELGVGYFNQTNDQANVRLDQNGDCTADSFGHGPYYRYWTQNFGRRNAVHPVIIERERYETACAEVALYTYGQGSFSQMRFSNDNVNWSAWLPFSPTATWNLPPGASGTATVYAQLGNATTPQHSASDTIEIAAGYPAAADINLSLQTVSGTASWEACDTITAGNGFTVAATGDVTFVAPTIVLTDGFTVAAGGSFSAGSR